MKHAPFNIILAAAHAYADRGICTTPLDGKAAYLNGWRTETLPIRRFEEVYKKPTTNIGIIYGSWSNLVDIDFDCDEAARIGRDTLPQTPAIFGRKSRPEAHRIYRVIDPGPRVTFEDPILKEVAHAKAMIVEYRGDGCQTMAPPSLHPEPGEGRLAWIEEGAEPAHATRERLLPQYALVDLEACPDPRTAIEAELGPLVRCEIVGAETAAAPAPAPVMESEVEPEPLWVGRFTFAVAVKSNIILRVAPRVMQALPGGFVVTLSATNEDEGPPVPRELWARTWERAADCGLTHGDVARRLGVSLPHLSNI
jgi:hypothetical protein